MRPLTTSRRVTAARAWWEQSIGGHGLRRMRELDLDTHALALCAQQVLCTAPLVVALSAVLQHVEHRNVSYGISHFFGLTGESSRDITRLFGRTSSSISTTTLVLGLITAIIFMTSVGAVQQRGFELIWTLPRVSGVRSYLRQLVFAPALTLFTVAVLVAGRLGRFLDRQIVGIGPWVVLLLQGTMTLLFYWWTQYWLLGGRVRWRALLPGAIAVSVLTSVQVQISREIVDDQISWQVHAYGLIGAVLVLSVWLGILSAVIFGGILLGALIAERRFEPGRSVDHAGIATPLTVAGMESSVPASGGAHHPG